MNLSVRIFTFFLAFHILNFSLDIPSYNLSSSTTKTNKYGKQLNFEQDEIESIMELVIETALQQNDFFPDTEENNSQEESFLKKIDWIVHSFLLTFSWTENLYISSDFVAYTLSLKDLSRDISPPPPKI